MRDFNISTVQKNTFNNHLDSGDKPQTIKDQTAKQINTQSRIRNKNGLLTKQWRILNEKIKCITNDASRSR